MKLPGTHWTKPVALAVGLLAATAANADYVQLTDDLTIHYKSAGEGDTTILFVPGWGMSTEAFSKQLEHFEGSTEYTFLTYDPRGQGMSSKTEGGHFYQQHGRDLNALIKALELNNIVLGGWSFGGNEALAYVNQFGTDALSGFIMIDAAPKSTGADNTKEWIWYNHDDSDGFEAFFTMGPLLDRQGTIAGFVDWMLADKSPENMETFSQIASQTSSTTLALLNAAGAHDDFTADLSGMEGNVPLQYITRSIWDSAVQEWAAAHTPSAMISTTMASHLGFWEDPEAFNAELNKFLATLK